MERSQAPLLTWQRGDDDMALRSDMIQKIANHLVQHNRNPDGDFINKVPSIAQRLEERLYRKAQTEAEYTDFSTLVQRIQAAIAEIKQRPSNGPGRPADQFGSDGNGGGQAPMPPMQQQQQQQQPPLQQQPKAGRGRGSQKALQAAAAAQQQAQQQAQHHAQQQAQQQAMGYPSQHQVAPGGGRYPPPDAYASQRQMGSDPNAGESSAPPSYGRVKGNPEGQFRGAGQQQQHPSHHGGPPPPPPLMMEAQQSSGSAGRGAGNQGAGRPPSLDMPRYVYNEGVQSQYASHGPPPGQQQHSGSSSSYAVSSRPSSSLSFDLPSPFPSALSPSSAYGLPTTSLEDPLLSPIGYMPSTSTLSSSSGQQHHQQQVQPHHRPGHGQLPSYQQQQQQQSQQQGSGGYYHPQQQQQAQQQQPQQPPHQQQQYQGYPSSHHPSQSQSLHHRQPQPSASSSQGGHPQQHQQQQWYGQEDSSPVGISKQHRDAIMQEQQQRLLSLRHAAKCLVKTGVCPEVPDCAEMQRLWGHMKECKNSDCTVTHCASMRYFIAHYNECKDGQCDVCRPIREAIFRSTDKLIEDYLELLKQSKALQKSIKLKEQALLEAQQNQKRCKDEETKAKQEFKATEEMFAGVTQLGADQIARKNAVKLRLDSCKMAHKAAKLQVESVEAEILSEKTRRSEQAERISRITQDIRSNCGSEEKARERLQKAVNEHNSRSQYMQDLMKQQQQQQQYQQQQQQPGQPGAPLGGPPSAATASSAKAKSGPGPAYPPGASVGRGQHPPGGGGYPQQQQQQQQGMGQQSMGGRGMVPQTSQPYGNPPNSRMEGMPGSSNGSPAYVPPPPSMAGSGQYPLSPYGAGGFPPPPPIPNRMGRGSSADGAAAAGATGPRGTATVQQPYPPAAAFGSGQAVPPPPPFMGANAGTRGGKGGAAGPAGEKGAGRMNPKAPSAMGLEMIPPPPPTHASPSMPSRPLQQLPPRGMPLPEHRGTPPFMAQQPGGPPPSSGGAPLVGMGMPSGGSGPSPVRGRPPSVGAMVPGGNMIPHSMRGPPPPMPQYSQVEMDRLQRPPELTRPLLETSYLLWEDRRDIEAHIASLARYKLRNGSGNSALARNFDPAKNFKAIASTMLRRLMDLPYAHIFRTKVDPVALSIPDYFDRIKHPMDLGTIKQRLESKTNPYRCLGDFAADVRITFNNAVEYNGETSDVGSIALEYGRLFEQEYNQFREQEDDSFERARFVEGCCRLCAQGSEFLFEPPTYYCEGMHCEGRLIKRDALMYVLGEHHVCRHCYAQPGTTVQVGAEKLPKSAFSKRKNDEEFKEEWIKCLWCRRKFHAICAMVKSPVSPKGEYLCPFCALRCLDDRRVDRAAQVLNQHQEWLAAHHAHSRGYNPATSGPLPLPPPVAEPKRWASDLPETPLSRHLEQRVRERVETSRKEFAAGSKCNLRDCDEPGRLTVRVVLNKQEELITRETMIQLYGEPPYNYPKGFPNKQKCILLFERIDGVDVLLFIMFLQYYGSDSPAPNQRSLYVAYLDSVNYFSAGLVRTAVYHELIEGLLEFERKNGYTRCFIWACPPQGGDDYIFNIHPRDQRVPDAAKLRNWYFDLLEHARQRGIIVSLNNLFDEYFARMPYVTHVPYFEGDWWQAYGEHYIKSFKDKRSNPLDLQSKEDAAKNLGGIRSSRYVQDKSRRKKPRKSSGLAPLGPGELERSLSCVSSFSAPGVDEQQADTDAQLPPPVLPFQSNFPSIIQCPVPRLLEQVPIQDNLTAKIAHENERMKRDFIVVKMYDECAECGTAMDQAGLVYWKAKAYDPALDPHKYTERYYAPPFALCHDCYVKTYKAEFGEAFPTSKFEPPVFPPPEWSEEAAAAKAAAEDEVAKQEADENGQKLVGAVASAMAAVSLPGKAESSIVAKETIKASSKEPSLSESDSKQTSPLQSEEDAEGHNDEATSPTGSLKLNNASSPVEHDMNGAETKETEEDENGDHDDDGVDETLGARMEKASGPLSLKGHSDEDAASSKEENTADRTGEAPVDGGIHASAERDQTSGAFEMEGQEGTSEEEENDKKDAAEEDAIDETEEDAEHTIKRSRMDTEDESAAERREDNTEERSGGSPNSEPQASSTPAATGVQEPIEASAALLSTPRAGAKSKSSRKSSKMRKRTDGSELDPDADGGVVDDGPQPDIEVLEPGVCAKPPNAYYRAPCSMKDMECVRALIRPETIDPDPLMDCSVFDSRKQFLSVCQKKKLQFDELRRAKHSTAVLLEMILNPESESFGPFCATCRVDLSLAPSGGVPPRYQACTTCADHNLCLSCFAKTPKEPGHVFEIRGGMGPQTGMGAYPQPSNQQALLPGQVGAGGGYYRGGYPSSSPQQQHLQMIQRNLALLQHTSTCALAQSCPFPECVRLQSVIAHARQCNLRATGTPCENCRRYYNLVQYHVKVCRNPACRVYGCDRVKAHLRQQQLAMSDRRVLAMMRNNSNSAAASAADSVEAGAGNAEHAGTPGGATPSFPRSHS